LILILSGRNPNVIGALMPGDPEDYNANEEVVRYEKDG
jgi:hypothetical protein